MRRFIFSMIFASLIVAVCTTVSAENPPISPSSKSLPVAYLDSMNKEYRLIKAGSFMMGSQLTGQEIVRMFPTSFDGEYVEYFNDAPCHKVTLTQDFYLAKSPVTKKEFQRFIEATDYQTTAEKEGTAWTYTEDGAIECVKGKNWKDPGFKQTDAHPVVFISYDDAIAYIAWLNERSQSSAELNGFKPHYRLPTEAEWECACRADTQTEFFWGNDEDDGQGYLNAAGAEKKHLKHFSFDDGFSETSPVGSFMANPWGLYDMLGNVWEWTSDWYGEYSTDGAADPKGAVGGACRVLRGGSWFSAPASCRCSYRESCVPMMRYADVGLRVAFSLTE